MKTRIAIIGTGMAGLACADHLSSQFDISIFDKSRGLSGRLSTRRARAAGGEGVQPHASAHGFDHGAQYFSATHSAFVDWLSPFEASGHVRRWQPLMVDIGKAGVTPRPPTEKLVFAPTMNTIGKALLAGRPTWRLYLDTPIDQISGTPGAWRLNADATEDDAFGPFDLIVAAVPAPQAVALLPQTDVTARLQDVEMLGCHTLMLGYTAQQEVTADWQCAHFDDDVLGFAAFNHNKPGRGNDTALVVQTRHAWSQAHIEDDIDAVAQEMKRRFGELTGLSVAAEAYDRVHRWRYASTAQPLGDAFLFDAAQGIAAIGDWCLGSKVQDAFLSGYRLAARLNAQ